MFNGIIFNTGKVIHLKKNKNSIQVGIAAKINFKKRKSVHQLVVMAFV